DDAMEENSALDKSNFYTKERSSKEVMQWLSSHLPSLQRDDALKYCRILMDDGFYSLDFLASIEEEDLLFMKKAHRRTLMKRFAKGSDRS
ncbi:hypothetical protein ACHAXR_007073, partial [Thalassiosira sp. AJA248-18]